MDTEIQIGPTGRKLLPADPGDRGTVCVTARPDVSADERVIAAKQPEQNQAPVVQRIRIRYAKRGPLRFTSHRDFARAFERAVRRAGVPIAYSQGFTPHPKISYASAAPTGVASEAEYLEIGLQATVDPDQVRPALDAALSPGLDVLEAVAAPRPGQPGRPDRRLAVADRAARGRRRTLAEAVAAFLAAAEVLVERLTKQGRRRFDARAAVVDQPSQTGEPPDADAGRHRVRYWTSSYGRSPRRATR